MQKEMNRFSKEELCDIYCNLENLDWDRRLGRKPMGFDSLPDTRQSAAFWWKVLNLVVTKESVLSPFKQQIELLTSPYERKKYQYVTICKSKTEEEFDKWWDKLLSNRNYQCNNSNDKS